MGRPRTLPHLRRLDRRQAPAALPLESLMNRVKWIFRIGAISNFLVTLGGIVDPIGTWSLAASVQKILPPSWQMDPIPALQPPSFLIIWCGMAFLWGVV